MASREHATQISGSKTVVVKEGMGAVEVTSSGTTA